MNRIRRAENKDIPQVLDLLTQVNMLHHRGRPDLFKGPATKYGAGQLEQIFADDERPVFVSVNERDETEGYAFCIVRQEKDDPILMPVKTLYIDDLCVEEEKRGKGIGRALYAHALAHARAIGCHNVTLNVWSLNGEALAFYRRLGMQEQKICMETVFSDSITDAFSCLT